jgi:membrane protein insertase Oxa1/YidC/SpoIIIJ
MKLIVATSLLLSVSLSTVSAFVAPSSAFLNTNTNTNTNSISRNTSSRLNLVLPPIESIDIHSTSTAIQHILDSLDSTSTLLSDAAAAAVTPEDKGWWENYLNLYKDLLLAVHSTIDGPLRNTGWDQTWGVSIALFTATVRTALLPLSVQQTKSAEYIKALKPYQDDIKEKFKDNKDMLNRATAKLFEDANANPLAGCLISVLQLPILIGLYRSITLLARDGELQEPFLWIPSLEGPVSAANDYRGMEWLTQGWVDGVPLWDGRRLWPF